VPGSGDYRLQPIFVEDMAEITVKAGQETGNMILDAVGPEIYTFNELVRLIAKKTGSKSRIIHLGPDLTVYLTGILNKVVKDVVLTRDEVRGLMANLLVSENPPLGKTFFSRWLEENAAKLGSGYSSELDRHYR
jgi:NADH dehydrogenase